MQKANINLVHIAFAFYPYMNLGGVPRAVYDMVRAQREKYNIKVITNRVEERIFESLYDVDVIYLKNLSRKMIYKYQFYTPLPERALFSALKDAEILHFHGHRNLLNDISFYITRLFKKPYIITTHGTLHSYESKKLIKKIYDTFLGRRFVDNARFIVVHSDVERRKLISIGVDKNKIEVIPNGIFFEDMREDMGDLSFFKKYKFDNRNRIILFLGKITRRKGVETVVDAFRRIKDKDLRLIIAGEVLQRLPDSISRDSRIMYIGHLEQREKVSAIISSELLLYPSIYEAFGYVPFESLYLNRPCIVGDDFGTSEHLSKVVPELMVSYGDSIELAEHIIKFIYDKKYKDEVVKRGREYIIEHFSVDKMVRRYDEIYKRVLE
ncbi:MAG: glycosyltransferase family 4 protein [Myxococcota bacterium]